MFSHAVPLIQTAVDVPSSVPMPLFDGALTSEEQVLGIIRSTDRPIIVDLDETLFLKNSTEEFIALARPAFLAGILLKCLNLVRPWRWFGGHSSRDTWRVMLVSILFPWTYARWRRALAAELAGHINLPLRDALAGASGPVFIASNGYRRLISPMLPQLRLPGVKLIACDLRRISHRRDGKLSLVSHHVNSDMIARSVVITDSMDDIELLQECAVPCLVKWTEAEYRGAFVSSVLYLPGHYGHNVKYPNKGKRKEFVRETASIWIIGGLSSGSADVYSLLGLLTLFVSMWCVYDAGYRENDRCASLYEDDPVLTPAAVTFDDHRFERNAWMWAAGAGIFGVFLLGGMGDPRLFLIWFITLLALRVTYWVYNRLDKYTRMWPYLLLQWFRFGGFIGVFVPGPIGWAACFSAVLPPWIAYVVYRHGRKHGISGWIETPTRTMRLVFFCMFLVHVVLIGGPSAIWSWATPFALGLFGYMAMSVEFKSLYDQAHRIDRKPQDP